MAGYISKYPNKYCNKDTTNLCMYTSLKKALKILLDFDYLDLTIDPNTAHYGLRFYTSFNRFDAVKGIMPALKSGSFVALQADIAVPAGYSPRFDNTDRNTIILICDLRAVAFVVQTGMVCKLLAELERNYPPIRVHDAPDSCNSDILNVLVNCQCDVFNNSTIYEIGIRSIDRSNNPLRGRIVAYDTELVWLQGMATDVPPTFYIIPLNYISFICCMNQ